MDKDKAETIEKKIDEIHSSALSEEEKLKIQKQVEKEIDEENRKRIAADYKASLKKKALFKDAKTGGAAGGLVPIFIDLPKVSEAIRLDGVSFYPEHTYHVLPAVSDMLLEIMGRGFSHEDEVSGKKDPNAYTRRSNAKAKT